MRWLIPHTNSEAAGDVALRHVQCRGISNRLVSSYCNSPLFRSERLLVNESPNTAKRGQKNFVA